MRDVERVCATSHLEPEEGILDCAMDLIIGFDSAGWFNGAGWNPDSVRTFVCAFALSAPPIVLTKLRVDVKRAREFVEYWDERGWIDAIANEGPERDRLYALHGVKKAA